MGWQRGLTLGCAAKNVLRRTIEVDFPGEYPDIASIRADRTKALRPSSPGFIKPPFPPVCVEDGNKPLLRAAIGAFSRFLRTFRD
jgi:hypothetical protein